MPNLRIVYDNAADRATSLTASTTSGTLVAANMQNEYKGQAHRSTGTSVTYTLTWTNGETIGSVALPATNLTGTATIRVRLYSDTAGTSLIADSGTITAAPGLNLGIWNWAQPLNVNAFAYGGVAKTTVWFNTQLLTRRCVIDLVDTSNPAGYIDCSRLVIGRYWEPTFNAENGMQLEIVDTSTVTRSDAGDLVADRGFIHDRLNFNFSLLPETDRTQLVQILRRVGASRNFLVSILPSDPSSIAEQDFIIYGKRSNSSITYEVFGYYKHSMEIIGW